MEKKKINIKARLFQCSSNRKDSENVDGCLKTSAVHTISYAVKSAKAFAFIQTRTFKAAPLFRLSKQFALFQEKSDAAKRARLATFPDYLVVQLKKFAVGSDWVPKKLGEWCGEVAAGVLVGGGLGCGFEPHQSFAAPNSVYSLVLFGWLGAVGLS